jgi:SAM-dependent methyltransferase
LAATGSAEVNMTGLRSSVAALRAIGSPTKRRAMSARRRAINLAARARAKRRNRKVSTAVSPDENMLFQGTLRLYFETGEDAFEQIRTGLAAAGVAEPRRILDLPSGYGRVLRYMRAAWPNAEIVAMEVRAGAPEFCAAAFGARPVRSANPLWTVDGVGDDFDLVWSGSLLTHFDSDAWIPTLRYFRDRLRPGGATIFTTHGERSIGLLARDPAAVQVVSAACRGWTGDYGVGDAAAAMLESARETGFAFESYRWDDSAKWGVSVSAAGWVRAIVEAAGGLEYVHHVPQGWSEHQDVWTFTRSR